MTAVDLRSQPQPSGCWSTDLGWENGNGYRRVEIDGHKVYLHRLSYELHVGPIPDGLVIDHLCGNRWCVAPHHLEPVTNEENITRGELPHLATIVVCTHGVQNPFVHCRPCRRAHRIETGETKSDRGPTGERITCPKGHDYSPENTYVTITKKGYRNRMCRTCMATRNRERRARAKGVTA